MCQLCFLHLGRPKLLLCVWQMFLLGLSLCCTSDNKPSSKSPLLWVVFDPIPKNSSCFYLFFRLFICCLWHWFLIKKQVGADLDALCRLPCHHRQLDQHAASLVLCCDRPLGVLAEDHCAICPHPARCCAKKKVHQKRNRRCVGDNYSFGRNSLKMLEVEWRVNC